jgi:hypothetical protein
MTYKEYLCYCFLLFLEGICYFAAALVNKKLDITWAMNYFMDQNESIKNVIQENTDQSNKRSNAKGNLENGMSNIQKDFEGEDNA